MPRTKTRGVALSPAEIAKLRSLIKEHGEAGAALLLEVARITLVRALGGLTLNRSTANGIQASLAKQETNE